MPQFQLDTSGTIKTPPQPFAGGTLAVAWSWRVLDPFTQGYIEALFFTEEESLRAGMRAHSLAADGLTPDDDESDESAAAFESLYPVGFSDLAPAALARIIADCAAFQAKAADLLALAYQRDYDAAQAGRDYWFTRNGHGVGFWDRDALEPDSAEYERVTNAMVDARRSNGDWDALLSQRNRLKAESLGERLSAACRYQGVDAYLGDDGKVYVA